MDLVIDRPATSERTGNYVQVERDGSGIILGYRAVIRGKEDSFYMIETRGELFQVYQDRRKAGGEETEASLVADRRTRKRAERLALREAKYAVTNLGQVHGLFQWSRARRVRVIDPFQEALLAKSERDRGIGCLFGGLKFLDQ